MTLKDIFDKNNCDKSHRHRYDLIYEADFYKKKNHNINILEVGVFRGESTKSWLEYFPNATVVAIDTFERIDEWNIKTLKNKRVRTVKSDSTLPNIKKHLQELDLKYDFIIDDGLHTPIANKKTFNNLFEFLKNDGIYYVEDFWPMFDMTEKQLSHKHLKKHKEDWNLENINDFLSTISMYHYEGIDNRQISKKPDSYIFKIQKTNLL